MRIGILHRYPIGEIKSTNASIHYLIDLIEKNGHTVDVLTFKRFNRINSNWKFLKGLIWIFYAPFLVINKKYDILYLDDSFPFYPALVKLASPKSKVILRIGDFHLMYYYAGLVYKFLHFFEKIAWKMADRIVAISWDMAHHITFEIQRPVDVALDPVDPKDFPEVIGKHHGTIMFHGTLTKNKNVDIFLEAAKLLPHLNFVIIGDGPDRRRLEKIAPHNVFFKGWVPFKNISRYISTCAIGVALRSDNVGNDYVVTSPFLQYGILGKPCLVTRRKVFGNYEWQFSDVSEMVEKIKILLNKPNEGEKLRQYVIKNHDAKKIGDQIWNLLSA